MLLTLDIGNTNVTAGVFDGDTLAASWRLATDAHRLTDEYALQLRDLLPMKGVRVEDVREVAICSVVPQLTSVFDEVARVLFGAEALVVGTGTRTGVRILYDNPRDVGADRIVDAAAAYHLYGGPAIVVDFGTATVFDAISADGAYLGGSIVAGLNIAAEALYQQTSQLRRIEMVAPPTAIGKNTVHAMQSGFVFGYAGLVDTIVGRFKGEMEAPNATVVATGGLAQVIADEASAIDVVNQELTLHGLRHIFALNAETFESLGTVAAEPGGGA
ncbi:MAG: type III pantothenate kinase [Chloroflexi bacterium]|nr:type III pantothenate kinase [Chloroflexota bacterium]